MTSLDWLLLDNNTLRGALPPSWSYMNKLTLLRLNHNRLTGTLPDSYGDMTNIDEIDLGSNMLNGSLPYLWRRLSKVTVITLSDNRLEGTLPPTWSALAALKALYVNNNSLHGAVPRDWADLRRLQSLDVSVNRLSGAVPDWFAATKWFNISHNEFSGLPVVCRLPNYLPTNFGMSHNKFAGRISVPCVPNTCADRWLARSLFDGNAFCGMCSLPPCTCAAPRAGDIGEPSISIVTAVSPSGCCAACQKHPQCVAAVYHPDIQYCELKNVTAPFEPSTKLEILVLQ